MHKAITYAVLAAIALAAVACDAPDPTPTPSASVLVPDPQRPSALPTPTEDRTVHFQCTSDAKLATLPCPTDFVLVEAGDGIGTTDSFQNPPGGYALDFGESSKGYEVTFTPKGGLVPYAFFIRHDDGGWERVHPPLLLPKDNRKHQLILLGTSPQVTRRPVLKLPFTWEELRKKGVDLS